MCIVMINIIVVILFSQTSEGVIDGKNKSQHIVLSDGECEGINEFEFSKMKKYIQWIKNYASFLLKKKKKLLSKPHLCPPTDLYFLFLLEAKLASTLLTIPLQWWLESLQFEFHSHLSIDTAWRPHHMSGCLVDPASWHRDAYVVD